MQVFIIGTPLETAMVLNERHLNNQINEAGIILDALNGAKAWSNHPCVLQYWKHQEWLKQYMYCLQHYADCKNPKCEYFHRDYAELHSAKANFLRPVWHTQEYFDQMKRRLYTKNPEHYKQWAHLDTSLENCYWSQEENRFIKYVNGKRIE
jgi:hypothetical protein